jgi:hypothetical protein
MDSDYVFYVPSVTAELQSGEFLMNGHAGDGLASRPETGCDSAGAVAEEALHIESMACGSYITPCSEDTSAFLLLPCC